MGFQKKKSNTIVEPEEDTIPTVPTTFNMRVDLKNKAKIYATMHNTKLDEVGEREGKLSLGNIINMAVEKHLENIHIK